jgi:hypothetical protein
MAAREVDGTVSFHARTVATDGAAKGQESSSDQSNKTFSDASPA